MAGRTAARGFRGSLNRADGNSRGVLTFLFESGKQRAKPFGHTVPWIGPTHANARCDPNGLNCNLIGDPQSVVVANTPTRNRRNVEYDLGIFAQDSWTLDRLTLNYGLRVELAAPSNSAASKPAGRFSEEFLFPELGDLPRYGPDFAPRLSAVYDVFGNARTAAKVGWGRYYHNYGITGVFPLNDYAPGAIRTDTRTWYDVALVPGTNRPDGPAGCESVPVGAPGSCNNPFGTNGDNVPQDWEIGIPGNNLFPQGSSIRPDDDLQRILDDVFTAGVQHEVWRGVSINFEYRRRWTRDDRLRSWDTRRFAVDANGRVVNNNVWALEQEVLAPAPYTMIVPIYRIFPAAQGMFPTTSGSWTGTAAPRSASTRGCRGAACSSAAGTSKPRAPAKLPASATRAGS
jgi:hypothetical protein